MKRKFMAKKKEVEIKVKGTQLESLSQTHGKDEKGWNVSKWDEVPSYEINVSYAEGYVC